MDISNITILFFPIATNLIQSGVKLNENSNFIDKFSFHSLFSIPVVILSYMQIISIGEVQFFGFTMAGLQFGLAFLVIAIMLIFADYMIINHVRRTFLRNFFSMLLLLITLAIAVIIIFYEYFLK